jgi:replication factor C small subunit
MNMLFEKYRPKKLEEFICDKPLYDKLVEMLRVKKSIPHILLVGESGVGKTSLAYIIKNELGWDLMEVNASDERGIDVVRGKIKLFTKTGGLSTKIMLLDEADMMTEESQHALRRLMEQFSENCRFILTANYESKIIPALKSRCLTIHLKPLTDEQIFSILKNITEKEKFTNILERDLWEIVRQAKGDARKAINLLESGYVKGEVEVNFSELIKLLEERRVEKAKEILDEFLKYNSPTLFVKNLFDWFMDNHNTLPSTFPKSQFLLLLADYEDKIARSNVPYLQLFSLLIRISLLLKEVEKK